jgi:hypothetical protein
MSCRRCPRYDHTARHCLDGKTNPSRKADSVLVAELLGARALCHYNPYRDALVDRMKPAVSREPIPLMPITRYPPAARRRPIIVEDAGARRQKGR